MFHYQEPHLKHPYSDEDFPTHDVCQQAIKVSTIGANVGTLGAVGNAMGATGFGNAAGSASSVVDGGANYLIWMCRGGTTAGYFAFRIGLFIVILSLLVVLGYLAARASNKSQLRTLQSDYDNPCPSKNNCTKSCYRDENGKIYCSYTVTRKDSNGKNTTQTFWSLINSQQKLESFASAHRSVPFVVVVVICLVLTLIVNSIVISAWGTYAQSQIQEAGDFSRDMMQRGMNNVIRAV